MRQPLVGTHAGCRRWLGATVLAASAQGALVLTSGCAVGESDVHRWETTEAGPEKLYAIVTHEKYSWPLREEAALSLVRMRMRNGKRVGLEYLVVGYDMPLGKIPGALSMLSEESRRRIVDGIAPKLVEAMQQPPPARPADGSPFPPDASVPYKDAAFAMLSHEPPLASDEKTKADLVSALTQWVQADFETRIDNSSQQFGVEQIMRFLGAPAVKSLPSVINENGTKVDRACSLIGDIGDDETKKRASEALVAMAKKIEPPDWIEKQRVLVNEVNAKSKITVTPLQVTEQLKNYQEQELEKAFTYMKRLGGRPVVEYCLAFARDRNKSEKMRTDALAAIENRIDKSVPGDVNAIFDILRDDSNPDKVRGVAMARFGELPKETIVPKLYSLFDKKWQLRLDGARLILRTMTLKDIPDFMRHFPPNDRLRMSLSEPIGLGMQILSMDAQGGPKPHEVLHQFLSGPDAAPRLIAIGSYYTAKKSDASPIVALEEDRMPIPKCDPADKCDWQCEVAKGPGSQEREMKTITTVGEFVKWCIEPQLQGG
jgi:hypothetical protein